jgi:hypothetical protein
VTLLSVLLLVTTVAGWVRSYVVADWVGRSRVTHHGANAEYTEFLGLTVAGEMRLSVRTWRSAHHRRRRGNR